MTIKTMAAQNVLSSICVLFLLIAIGFFSLRFTAKTAFERLHTSTTAISLQQVEKLLGLTFPPSASLTNARLDDALDTFLIAKVNIGPNDIGAFKANAIFSDVVFAASASASIGRNDEPWWDADGVVHKESCEVSISSSEVLNILISYDSVSHTIIYLEYFELY